MKALRSNLTIFGPAVGVIAALCMPVALSSVASAADPGTLVVNMAAGPSSLDPAWACANEDIGFIQNFYPRLTQYGSKPGPDGTTVADGSNMQPYLAKSWTISDDHQTYTFQLDPNFKFGSGKPIDAAAVKYSFERTMEVAGCGKYFILDGFLSPPLIDRMDVVDPETLVIHITHPDANVLSDWAMPSGSILDPAVVEANGGIEASKQSEFLASNIAGNGGPFILESYTPNQGAVLVANPTFGGVMPASKRIEINFVGAAPTLLMQARTGGADVTFGLPAQAVQSLASDPNVRVLSYPQANSQQIILPNGKAPWDNAKVREAVSYAIPYSDLLQKIAFGYGTLYYGPLSPSIENFNPELSTPRTFDLEKAKALMAESGLKTPVDVELMIQEGDAVQQQVGTILQALWKQIGINVTIHVAAAAEFQDRSFGHKAQAFLRLDGPAHGLGPGYFLGYDMICGSNDNLTEVCLPEADKLLVQARASNDPAERQQLYDQITKLWTAASPKIPLYETQQTVVLNKDVKTFFYNPLPDFRSWSK